MSPTSDSTPGTAGEPGRDGRLITWMALLAIVIAAVDQLTKYWAESTLTGREPIDVIGDVIQFRLLYNSGAAFSIGTGATWVLTLVVVVVVAVVIKAATKIGSRGWSVAFGLLLGGAFGNLIDRLFRQPGFPEGHVVDFIDYADLFVGNIADIAIVAAAALIAVLTLRGIGIDGRRQQADDPANPPAQDS